MDPLELFYDKAEDIPEGFASLYVERNKRFELTNIKGLKTDADIERLQGSLHKAQNENKGLRERVKVLDGLGNIDELQAKLDRIEELQALVDGKFDESKVEELAEKRAAAKIKSATAPLERELKKITDALTAEQQAAAELRRSEATRSLHDELREAAGSKDLGFVSEAVPDLLMLGERVFERTEDGKFVVKDKVGFTPGLDPKSFLQDIRDSKARPHWFGATAGGGSRGGRAGGGPANNPWSAEGWNLTAQGAYVREHGREKANEAAKAAGTTVGGGRPKPKAAAK